MIFSLSRKAVPVTAYPDVQQPHHGSKIIHFNEDIYSTDTRFVLCLENDKNEYAEKLFATLKNSTKLKAEKLFSYLEADDANPNSSKTSALFAS